MSKTLTVSDDTYEAIKGQLEEVASKEERKEMTSLEDAIGQSFFFRTVTYHLIGRVKKIIGNIWELEDAAWIADSGRFATAIKDGTLNEVEPVGRAFINFDSVTDFFPWCHPLPKEQK